MGENINWNELVIGDEQAETLAYCIYDDIDEYVEQNAERFTAWIIDKVIFENQYIIMTINGIELLNKYEYEMCNYFTSKYRG